MALPDASQLLNLPRETWRELGQRLAAAGLNSGAASRFFGMLPGMPDSVREPLIRWNLRRIDHVSGVTMRLFLHREPVSLAEATRVLAPLEVGPFLDVGFLISGPGGVVSYPFRMNLFNEILIVTDDLLSGALAVMGAGETTQDICNAAFPLKPIDRALDLGCGAGTGALLVAARARHAVGTDINPRAIVLSRLNARINGIENVEFRESDGFEALAGERFDLIFSQPPFVPMAEHQAKATYLHGGSRGDELAVRLLAAVPDHLTPSGRAVFLVEWPIIEGDSIEARVRGALAGQDVTMLMLCDPGVNADRFAAGYAAAQHPGLGREFEGAADELRSHLDSMGIEGFRFGFVVLEPATSTPSFTASIEMRSLATVRVTGGRIESLIVASRLAVADGERVLGSRLRLPDGTVIAGERTAPALDAAPAIRARFTNDALLPEMQLSGHALQLVELLQQVDSVRDAVIRFAEIYNAGIEDAYRKVLPAVRQALAAGIVEVR